MMRRAVLLLLFATLAFGAAAQEFITATQYFDQAADRYSGIQSYSADVTITVSDEEMIGELVYLRPSLLRIDFSQPAEQVIVSDGALLSVFVPQNNVVLQQQLRARSGDDFAGLATPEGLALLRQGYSIAYTQGPDPQPLDGPDVVNGSREPVVKLTLTRRRSNEGFRQIELAFGANGLIRRITGTTISFQQVAMDFRNVEVNQPIAATVFEYDAPGTANTTDNFLFGPQ